MLYIYSSAILNPLSSCIFSYSAGKSALQMVKYIQHIKLSEVEHFRSKAEAATQYVRIMLKFSRKHITGWQPYSGMPLLLHQYNLKAHQIAHEKTVALQRDAASTPSKSTV
jgi:hypothetical protein